MNGHSVHNRRIVRQGSDILGSILKRKHKKQVAFHLQFQWLNTENDKWCPIFMYHSLHLRSKNQWTLSTQTIYIHRPTHELSLLISAREEVYYTCCVHCNALVAALHHSDLEALHTLGACSFTFTCSGQ